MADIDNVTVGENNYNLRDTPARNAMPTQGQVNDIIEALDIIAAKSNTPYNASNKLPTDYADDTNQTHKFATAAQLTQIETNKNNILTVANQSIQYNYSSVSSMSGTPGFTSTFYFDKPIPTGTYRIICNNVRTDTSKQCQFQVVGADPTTQYTNIAPTISTAVYISNEITTTFELYGIKIYCNTPTEVTNLAIIPKSLYDAGFTAYQPYALSNVDLTTVTKQNENNILLLTANGGGKNLLNSSSPVRLYNATYSNGIVTQVTDDTKSAFTFALQGYSAPTTFVKMLNQVNTTENGRIRLSFTKDNTFSIIAMGHSGSSEDCKIFFDISNLANGDYYAQINLINYQQSQGKYQFNELMIYDTKYDMLYQPYALSNADLTAATKQNEANILIEDITDSFVIASGYTLKSNLSAVYVQNKHVFGTLIIAINSGTLPTGTETSIATTTYKPKKSLVGFCGFGVDEWQIDDMGYLTISQYNGVVSVRNPNTGTGNTVVNIQLDYIVS